MPDSHELRGRRLGGTDGYMAPETISLDSCSHIHPHPHTSFYPLSLPQFQTSGLPCGVQNLTINLMKAEDWEPRKALSLVKARCAQLTEFSLFDPVEARDVESQTIIWGIILHNYHTLKFFYPPWGSFSTVVKAVLTLPALDVLEMHSPQYLIPSHTTPCTTVYRGPRLHRHRCHDR